MSDHEHSVVYFVSVHWCVFECAPQTLDPAACRRVYHGLCSLGTEDQHGDLDTFVSLRFLAAALGWPVVSQLVQAYFIDRQTEGLQSPFELYTPHELDLVYLLEVSELPVAPPLPQPLAYLGLLGVDPEQDVFFDLPDRDLDALSFS
jgi:hypothetical protein